jgi:protease-4
MLDRLDWRHVVIGLGALFIISLLAAMVPILYVSVNPDVGRAAMVKLHGPITSDSGVQQQGITPQSVASLTEKATKDDPDVVIYEINSPGGGVVASKEAARVIRDVDTPTVCLLKEVAASGGYWMASACDRIVADSLSITGSIGVTSTYLEFSGLLNDFGVEYVNLTSGRYKDMGSRFKNLTDAEQEKFDDILGTVHDEFIQAIAENRNMSEQAVRDAATGEIYLGQDAKERGLVDTLGGRQTALNVAKNMTGVEELKTNEYTPPRRLDLFNMLFTSIGEGIADGLKGEQRRTPQARYER